MDYVCTVAFVDQTWTGLGRKKQCIVRLWPWPASHGENGMNAVNNNSTQQVTRTHIGVESGGTEGTRPSSEKFRCPPRFGNEGAQIRCLFRFLGYFGVRSAT